MINKLKTVKSNFCAKTTQLASWMNLVWCDTLIVEQHFQHTKEFLPLSKYRNVAHTVSVLSVLKCSRLYTDQQQSFCQLYDGHMCVCVDGHSHVCTHISRILNIVLRGKKM